MLKGSSLGNVYQTTHYDFWVRPGRSGTYLYYHDNMSANASWSQPLLCGGVEGVIPDSNQFTIKLAENAMNGKFSGQTIVSEPLLTPPCEMNEEVAQWIHDKHESQVFDRDLYDEMTRGASWSEGVLRVTRPNLPSDILKGTAADLAFRREVPFPDLEDGGNAKDGPDYE